MDHSGSEFSNRRKRTRLLTAGGDDPGLCALQKLWSNCAVDYVAADDRQTQTARCKVRKPFADRVFTCFFAGRNGFVRFVDRLPSIEMGPVACDENDGTARRHQG